MNDLYIIVAVKNKEVVLPHLKSNDIDGLSPTKFGVMNLMGSTLLSDYIHVYYTSLPTVYLKVYVIENDKQI